MFDISRDGGGIVIAGTGHIRVEDAIAGVEAVRRIDPDDETSHTIIDFSAAERFDFSVEEFHRLALAIRTTYSRSAEYRFAMVAASAAVEAMLRLFVDVRDLLTARQISDLPELGIFATVGEA